MPGSRGRPGPGFERPGYRGRSIDVDEIEDVVAVHVAVGEIDRPLATASCYPKQDWEITGRTQDMKASLAIGKSCALALALASSPAHADEALARNAGCLDCHAADTDVAAPTFDQIAERYAGEADARARLIDRVKNGGKGSWSALALGAPMPGYSMRLDDAQIAQLVDWLLNR